MPATLQPDLIRIAARVSALRARHAARDARMRDVRHVRLGDFNQVAPDLFSEQWPRPIVANLISDSAIAAAGALAPLPTLTCRTANGVSDNARAWADKRTKIAQNYLEFSKIAEQQHRGADQFFTYGLIVSCIEPDFDCHMPRITHEDSIGIYPVWNRAGDTIEVARVFWRTRGELKAEYPQFADRLDRILGVDSDAAKIEVVKYVSAKEVVMYVPTAGNLTLQSMPNPLGECYYECTMKPGLDDEIRGSYDDLIFVQLARHALQTYALEAAMKSVQAPIVVGPDVLDVPMGPDAIIRTQGGVQSVGRVNLQVPNQVWGGIDSLKTEMLTSAAVPPSPGSIDSSIITGAGVRELMGGYSQQIASAQEAMKGHFRRIIAKCFRMDELVWPKVRKSMRGLKDGVPYDEKYTAGTDINGDHTVDITYGFAAGLDANRALVLLLQAQGAGLISRDLARRGLPAGINAHEEETKIEVEQLRDSLIQGMSALAQSVPQLVANGQDPTGILSAIATMTSKIQAGGQLEEVIKEVFAPKPPPPAPTDPNAPPADPNAPPGAPGEDAPADGSGDVAGFGTNGMPAGLKNGQAVQGPNARPPLNMLFAGLSGNGSPTLQAGVSRYNPAV